MPLNALISEIINKKDLELQTKFTIILACRLINFSLKCLNLLNSVEKQKVLLQTIVTIILAFIIFQVFTFIEIFLPPYRFDLTVLVFQFHLAGLPEYLLKGRSNGNEHSQLLFILGVFNFSLTFERHFSQTQDSWLTVFFPSILNISSYTFWPLKFLKSKQFIEKYGNFIEDPLNVLTCFSCCFQESLF